MLGKRTGFSRLKTCKLYDHVDPTIGSESLTIGPYARFHTVGIGLQGRFYRAIKFFPTCVGEEILNHF